MAGVDNRIVTMKFDNAQFEQGARTTMSTLEKLKQSMNFGSIGTAASKALGGISGLFAKFGIKNPFATAEKGAADLGKAAGGVATGGLTSLDGAVTGISNRFLAMSTIAITALSNITNRAIDAGASIAKALTVDPIKLGLEEYETNMNSIQTILANTQVSGATLDDVNAALDELNHYSDKTIYNFSEMAKNIGTFTAAGVDLDTSVSSIKGIANLAALSGSNSQQAATAMYQLSQEIAAGRVSLMGWNSVVNAGMGGSTFQRALAQTAVAMGDIDESAIKLQGKMKNVTVNGQSFRDSIMAKPGEQSWLSSKVLLATLKQFTGDMSTAQLKAQGFNEQQIKDIQQMAETAQNAATKVKTLKQVFDVAKETTQSGWSQSFRLVFGDFKEARSLFTEFSNYVNGFLNRSADARNRVLGSWKKLGGRDVLIDSFKSLGKAITGVIVPIRKAFADIFPKTRGKELYDLTLRFQDLAEALKPSSRTMANIRDIAGGVFAIFSIGGQILGGVVDLFKTLFGVVGGGNGSFLDFAAGIGNAVKEFDAFLEESGLVTVFFESLANVLSVPLILLRGVGELIGSLFNGFDESAAGKVGDAVDTVGNRLSGLEVIGDKIMAFFRGLGGFFQGFGKFIGDALMGIGDIVAGAFTEETFGSTLDAINTGLLAALVLLIKQFFSTGVNIDVGGGFFESIKESLGAATGALETMQNSLKADILMKIAISIGALAASLLVLSMIDPAALRKALGAMGAGFGILITAMAVLMKVMGPTSIVQLYVITTAVTKMAASILLLSFALKILAGIKFGDMVRGLVGLGLMLGIITKAMVPLAAGSKGMVGASASLILVAIAINMLAVALKIFATMSWAEMIKGLAGLTGTLLALAIGLKLMPPMQASALGLLALGVSMNLLAVALKIFATMSWEEMSKGLVTLAGALGIISIAMNTMPKTMMLQSVALVAVAGAMVILAGALKIMGSMGWKSIAKGLVVLGGALLIISVGLNAIGAMGTVGAIGLLATAVAMTALLPVLVAFGAMDWMTILKSLTMLAGVFVILGIAGYALAPVAPVIVALGAALLLLGAGLALAGAGALMAATAFGIVVAAGAAGAQIMVNMLNSIIQAIPPAMAAFGKGVVQFAVAIGQGAPRIAQAFGKILANMINTVIENTPRLARMFLTLLNAAIRVVVTAIPRIVDAGLRLIIGFLNAISKHLPEIIDLAADIIVKFVRGIARNLPDIIQSGVELILAFIRGLTRAVNENSEAFGEAGAELGIALVRGIASGISGAAGEIKGAAMSAAQDAMNSVKDFFGIDSPSKLMRDEIGVHIPAGMAVGIRQAAPLVQNEMETMGRTAMDKLGETMRALDEGFAMNADLNPTITPVLDLAKLTQDANKMSAILATSPIMPVTSYQAASAISMETTAAEEAGDDDDSSDGGGNVYNNYEQHLHSPKALDPVTIYRGTKSIFALEKERL